MFKINFICVHSGTESLMDVYSQLRFHVSVVQQNQTFLFNLCSLLYLFCTST
jgi:hypothetical protein